MANGKLNDRRVRFQRSQVRYVQKQMIKAIVLAVCIFAVVTAFMGNYDEQIRRTVTQYITGLYNTQLITRQLN